MNPLFRSLAVLALPLAVGACDRLRAATADDPYDPAKRDLKSPPARLSNETPSGPYAAGGAF